MVRCAEGPRVQQPSAGRQHAGDAVDIFVVSIASSKLSQRRQDAREAVSASMVLPEPGGPIMSTLWPPAAGNLQTALGRRLAADVAKIGSGFGNRDAGRARGRSDGREVFRLGEHRHHFGEVPDAEYIHAFDD